MVDCEHDPKTSGRWARLANASCSTIREHCRLVQIKAHHARDFGRVLRAICWSGMFISLPFVLSARTVHARLRGAPPEARVRNHGNSLAGYDRVSKDRTRVSAAPNLIGMRGPVHRQYAAYRYQPIGLRVVVLLATGFFRLRSDFGPALFRRFRNFCSSSC